MVSDNKSILALELEPLNAAIEQVREKIEGLEVKLRSADAELESFSTDKQRFDALREVCDSLDKLGELEATELFWAGTPGEKDAADHVGRLRERITEFEGEVRKVEGKQNSLKEQINLCQGDLNELHHEVRDAYAREERRREQFIIERKISSVPYRSTIMPWTNEGESEMLFRRSVLIALLVSILFGSLIPLVNVPVPDRSAVVKIPERLAMLVKKEPPKPEPVPQRPKEEKKIEPDQEKPKTGKTKGQPAKGQPTNTAATKAARKKAESTGVLAFKSSFADLMDETPVARLGTEARLSKNSQRAPGQAQARRSLVAMATGSSGGIGNSAVSRNVGSGGGGGGGNADRIGGVGFARVASSLTGLAEEGGRPVSDGPGAGRTDEEIQIVFDRYKALLYRIYNKQLRKNPTLRGKLLLRITIEPNGSVSKCKVESTDLESPELVDLIVARVKKFNFSPKKGVPKTTILYPIDFLPAG